MLIDTHCHLDFQQFDQDRREVIARAAAAGVHAIIVPALDLENARAVVALAEQHPRVFAAVGVHPNSSAEWDSTWIAQLRQLAQHEKVVAVGEIGLDYYWDKSPPVVQKRAFKAQLELAAELDLPVIIHNREASEDVLELLGDATLTQRRERPGVLHSFSASREVAERAVEMGYYLGFTGPLTYKTADELREVAAWVPSDRLLVETDAPYLTPAGSDGRRGGRNEPAFVRRVADRIAAIRGIRPNIVDAMTTENASCLFGRRILE